jgi:hypothetical protein
MLTYVADIFALPWIYLRMYILNLSDRKIDVSDVICFTDNSYHGTLLLFSRRPS